MFPLLSCLGKKQETNEINVNTPSLTPEIVEDGVPGMQTPWRDIDILPTWDVIFWLL